MPKIDAGSRKRQFQIFEVSKSDDVLTTAKELNIMIYCYYILVRRSSMHILFKFELKIPPSYPQTTFHYELVIEYSFIIKA